jgi:hypothetical protein
MSAVARSIPPILLTARFNTRDPITINPINAWMTSANGPRSWHESGSISVASKRGCQRWLGRSRGG